MAEAVERRGVRPVAIVRHPIYNILLPVPVVCFTGALITDLIYVNSENLLWVNFSGWLIFAGLVFGFIAGVLLLIEICRGFRSLPAWVHLVAFYAAFAVEFVNIFVHGQDGWTAVVPTGLILSIIAVVLILVAGWLWRSATLVPVQ